MVNTNKKGAFPERNAPLRFFPFAEKLKLESSRNLNLSFTIQSAVRNCSSAEIGIEGQNVAASSVKYAFNAKDLGAIGYVEAFGK